MQMCRHVRLVLNSLENETNAGRVMRKLRQQNIPRN